MESTETSVVDAVLAAFLDSEEGQPWERFDDYMSMLNWLNDNELYREVDIAYLAHVKSSRNAGYSVATAMILEAIKELLDLNQDGQDLTVNTRYIFEYYLSLDHCGLILNA